MRRIPEVVFSRNRSASCCIAPLDTSLIELTSSGIGQPRLWHIRSSATCPASHRMKALRGSRLAHSVHSFCSLTTAGLGQK